MRAMPIQVRTGSTGFVQLKASFRKNWMHYLQEALGLAIFMISACFFSVMLYATGSHWHQVIQNNFTISMITGLLMGFTALIIFYSPFTAPSGSHINPAVTLTYLRLGKMCRYDALFYIFFQFIGGTIAVYLMQFVMGNELTDAPVRSAVTIPGKAGLWAACAMEFSIAFVTMTIVLFTSASNQLKRYTRLLAGLLVCLWVIVAGPVSGFGMNPARSFASALPAHIWTAFWIYLLMPIAGMLGAAELFLWLNSPSPVRFHRHSRFIK
ncbi:MIP/aquaporin family protein [Niastella vici]|nr:aquaporin [Niastella vici]